MDMREQPYAETRRNTLTTAQHNDMVVCVIPDLDASGNLPPGVHRAGWKEFCDRFGWNAHRRRLMRGLESALDALRAAGCRLLYVGGSFVTAKETPMDFDGCWDPTGVDPAALDPVLLLFDEGRAAQKAKYLGEMFPDGPETGAGMFFRDFFQVDKETGARKGIVVLDLRELPE